jgi:integrase
VIDTALWQGERDPERILDRVRGQVLNERQREQKALGARLQRQVTESLTRKRTREADPRLDVSANELNYLSDAIATGLIGSASYDLMKLAIRQTLERLGSGVYQRVVMEALGHSQMRTTTDMYSHVMPALGKDAADRMGRALWD